MAEDGYVGRACPCGVIYIDPQPDPSAVAPSSDAHLESYYALPAALRFAWASRFVSAGRPTSSGQFEPTRRFLEVGCGSGQLIGRALAAGFAAEGVEPSEACATWVRRRYGVAVEQVPIEQSRLPDARFDLIFHVDLMSHFPDPVRALESMARLLRPDGVMCFEVGLFAGLDPRWYPWVGRPRFPAHRWFYSVRSLEQVLRRAGFDLVAVESFAIAPSVIISSLLRRALPSRLEAVPTSSAEAEGIPARGTLLQRAYARLHHLLRYRLGAVIPFPGPRTALVAARRTGAPR
jgi:SAM-dependent methyltransferase